MNPLAGRIKVICAGAVSDFGNNISLFRAGKSHTSWAYKGTIKVKHNKEKKVLFPKGKAAFYINPISGVSFGTDSFRIYIPVEKEVTLGGSPFERCDVNIVFGARVNTEVALQEKSGDGKAGWLINMRVTFHCRMRK